jgi:predicted NodU family carbamoyl transferase
MIGYELIGGLYDNAYIFARTQPLMTGVIGFNSPVEYDHSVGVIGDGKFVFAGEEERWTRHKTLAREPPMAASAIVTRGGCG